MWVSRGRGVWAPGRQSRGRRGEPSRLSALPEKRGFSLERLRQDNGSCTSCILLTVSGKVFDVTNGSKFCGLAGPHGIFAGRDASRGLATFCLDKDALKDEYDDLSDLNAVQMESVREWEMQFKGTFILLGSLQILNLWPKKMYTISLVFKRLRIPFSLLSLFDDKHSYQYYCDYYL